MSKFDMNTTFPQKVGLVAEELGVENQINFAGVFDPSQIGIPEEAIGIYSPQSGIAGINKDYAGTYKENTTAVHEGIHPLQYEKMLENGLDEDEEGVYQMLMEGQASKYTPGESSYPELEMFYESFMDTFDSNYLEGLDEEYRKVYEAMEECEEILEKADLDYTMEEEFKEIDENYGSMEDVKCNYSFSLNN